jgi:hypothetical protein
VRGHDVCRTRCEGEHNDLPATIRQRRDQKLDGLRGVDRGVVGEQEDELVFIVLRQVTAANQVTKL